MTVTTTAAAHRLSPMIPWFFVLLTSAWGGLALAEPLPRQTIEFHVTPDGDDANPGTAARVQTEAVTLKEKHP